MSERLDCSRLRQIMMRLKNGLSHRQIAIDMRLNRKTIAKYSKIILTREQTIQQLLSLDDDALYRIIYAQKRLVAPRQPDTRLELLIEQVDYFKSELARPGVTMQLLWREYRNKQKSYYRYASFCKYLKIAFAQQKATYRKRYQPAEVLMIDFAGDPLYYTDKESGQKVACVAFVSVLGYSNYTYMEVLPSASLPYLIRALNNNLRFICGVPLNVLTDNMAQLVKKADRYEPSFTEAAEGWANHNGTMLQTARVARPQDKSAVEAHVRIVYQRIYATLRNHTFYSLQELNEAAQLKLREHNQLNFQNRSYSRYDQFVNEELPLLRPLPQDEYKMQKCTRAKVQKNYHILLGEDKHFYSVPFTYVGKTVHVIYTTEIVEIYHQMVRIAIHSRTQGRFDYTTVDDHMPVAHQQYAESQGYRGSDFLNMAARIGSHTQQYVEKMLQSRRHEAHAYMGCLGLLRLGGTNTYGPQRLEAACAIGLQLTRYSYKTIESILKNNADKHWPSTEEPSVSGNHENLRGPDAF